MKFSTVFEAFNERRASVAAVLGELTERAVKVGAASLVERLRGGLIAKLQDDRFNLVVVGEFNHGKTSLVNAMLCAGGEGTDVLPVGVTPTTAVIHHVAYGAEPRAKIVRADDSEQAVEIDEITRFCAGGDGAQPPVGAEDAVLRVDVDYPSDLLRERITLVDTPGVNDLCLQRADITYQYIPQADAVLFVIDAGQPLKESERLFLKEKLIAQSRDKIVFVVTKADIWSADERDEAMAYIRDELNKLVEAPIVFAVSPQRALAGEETDSGISALLAHLTAFLAEERGRIVLDNAIGEGLEACHSLTYAIDARRRAARMSQDELERRISRIEEDLAGQRKSLDERRAGIREEVAAIRAWLRCDLDRFCDDMARELPLAIEAASLDELRQHLPGFLENIFGRWAKTEADEVAKALEDLAEKTVALMREDAHDSAKRLSVGSGKDVAAPDLRIDTFGYDLSVAALFSVGMGMVFSNALLGVLMASAAPVLAYYLKGKVELETRTKAAQQASLAVRDATTKVAPKLDAMITDFADRLDDWVTTVGKELHRELIDVLRASQAERGESLPDTQRTAGECDALDEELARVQSTLEQLRGQLWGG